MTKKLVSGALVLLSVAACSLADAPNVGALKREPTKLISSFHSYMTPAQARAAVVNGASWTEESRDTKGPFPGCPRYALVEVRLQPWKDRGHSGDLLLEFINGRLELTRFYPIGFDAYLNELRGRGVAVPDTDDEAEVGRVTSPPRTVVEAVPDADPPFVWWLDKALYEDDLAWRLKCEPSS